VRINLTPPADLEELFRVEPYAPIDEELAAATQRLLEAHMAAQPEPFYDWLMRQPVVIENIPDEPGENHHFL
jgi:hypothetical protein